MKNTEEKPCKVITLHTYKGGSGKTTISTILAGTMALDEKRVLVIDLDGQENLSAVVRANKKNITHSHGFILNSYNPDYNVQDYITKTMFPRIDCIASKKQFTSRLGLDLGVLNFEPEMRLKKAIEDIKKLNIYDYIIIDGPATIGMEAVNMYVASDYVIIPIECSEFNIMGISDAYIFYLESKRLNPNLKCGLMFSRVDIRENATKTNIQSIKKHMSDKAYIFETMIRVDTKIKESQGKRVPLPMYDATTRASREGYSLYQELVKELEGEN